MLRPWVFALCLLAWTVAAAPADAVAPASELEFRRHVAGLVESGELDLGQSLLIRFQRIFAPADLPEALRSPDAWPDRSATLLIHEYRAARPTLAPQVRSTIDAYLSAGANAAATFLETAHFRFAYETAGANAVSAEDLAPANGVPDFVDRVAGYAETAWSRLIGEIGFAAPILTDGKLPVSFREMGVYGYTEDVGGATRIVLHRSFEGFPANQDPEGSVAGAAKVTAAHELKHASQHASSGWSEGGWLEADAMWAEDLVFDATDDYLRYLPYGSPVSHPDSWLPDGVASYEDCLWQHLLAESFGAGILVDFFAHRSLHLAEPVLRSFDVVLAGHASSLREAGERLGCWTYYCGANAWQRPIGFEEADAYPTPPLSAHLAGTPSSLTSRLPALGTHHVLVASTGRTGQPWVQFLGEREVPFALSALLLDASGHRSVVPIPLTASNAASQEIPVDWSDVVFLVLAVTSADVSARSADYLLTVDDQNAVGVDPLVEAGFRLLPNRPNPFRNTTSLVFTVPSAGPVRLSVLDVGGRLVRRILGGETLPAGTHERTWDGRDQAGRPAAPGVYAYRLEAAGERATRKMLLLR